VLVSAPFAPVVLVNRFATQWPDGEADATVGRRTLVVRWSRGRLRTAYAVVGVAAVGSLLAVYPEALPTPVALAVGQFAGWWLG